MIEKFFNPESVAIVGASDKPGKVGKVILENFVKKFRGEIYPVNPNYESIMGLKCYKKVSELPKAPDLAVIVIPADGVPEVLEDLGKKGTKAVIIISGGFRETNTPRGEMLENKVKEIASKYGMRIVGPNCIGIFDNWSGVDTFFLPEEKMKRPPRGHVGFISQSGAFASALIDWMAYNGIGVSRAVSYGNKVDVDDVDLLKFFKDDEKTKIVLMYLEGLKTSRGKEFIRVARELVRVKPVVIYKAGKTSRGSMAAASHTAALAGDYSLYKSAIKQAGLIEADSFDDIMDITKILLTQPLMKGNRVYIVTDAGGVGVMLTDALTSQGFELPRTPPELKEELKSILPPHCIIENPIDLTGDTDDERYMKVLEKILPRSDVDAVVVVALPQVPGIRGVIADYLIESKKKYGKPIIALAIGGEEAKKISEKLESGGVPVFESPERAAKALKALYTYSMIKKRCD
ncbi:MAG: CoA-binding protein [Thermosphaera sp.]